MNTIKRMYASNKKLKTELERRGFHTIQMFPHTRWSKDVFGLFDGVCLSFDDCLYWIQFKTGYSEGNIKVKIEEFCAKTNSNAVIAELIKHARNFKNRSKYESRLTFYGKSVSIKEMI
jgi:hypothetical protein